MKKVTTNKDTALKELQELFADIVISKKSRKGVLVLSNKTKKRYTEFLKKFTSSDSGLKSTFGTLPNSLPTLPNHFETWIAILAFLSPIVLSVIFCWLQVDLFFATLIAVGATPVCILMFYVLSKRALEKQNETIGIISKMIELLKSNRINKS